MFLGSWLLEFTQLPVIQALLHRKELFPLFHFFLSSAERETVWKFYRKWLHVTEGETLGVFHNRWFYFAVWKTLRKIHCYNSCCSESESKEREDDFFHNLGEGKMEIIVSLSSRYAILDPHCSTFCLSIYHFPLPTNKLLSNSIPRPSILQGESIYLFEVA
jgi:hypothetical protein